MRSADQPVASRTRRLWIVETLVVVGVLAFGYFAATQDTARPGSAGSMLTELVR
jgi:hypothetical protein